MGATAHQQDRGRNSSQGSALGWDADTLQVYRVPRHLRRWQQLYTHTAAAPGTVGWCIRCPLRAAMEVAWGAAQMAGMLLLEASPDMRVREPAQVRYVPEAVVCVEQRLQQREGQRAKAAGPAEQAGESPAGAASERGVVLVSAFIDPWTLEMSPAGYEDCYEKRHQSWWLPWLAAERALGVVTCSATLHRVLSIQRIGGWIGTAFPFMLALLLFLNAAAVAMSLVPSQRRAAFRTIVLVEVLLVVGHSMYAMFEEEREAQMGDGQRTGMKEEHLLVLFWVMRFWLRCSFLFKHMILVGATNLGVLLATCACGGTSSSVLTQAGRLSMTVLLSAAFYRFERRSRRRFLQALAASAAPQQVCPSAFRQLVPPKAMLRSFPGRITGSLSASDWPQTIAGWTSGDATLHASRPSRCLHIYLPHAELGSLPPSLGSSLLDALGTAGLCCYDSYVACGSVRLNLVLEGEGAEEPALGSLVLRLQSDSQLRSLMAGGLNIQDGSSLWSIREEESVLTSQLQHDVPVPEVEWVGTHILPMSEKGQLDVNVRLPSTAGRRSRAPMFLILHTAGSCLKLEVPLQAVEEEGLLLHITHEIQLPRNANGWPIDVYMLEVCKGELFSAPVPVAACGEWKLGQELEELRERWPSEGGGEGTFEDVLWALRDLSLFWAVIAMRGRSWPSGLGQSGGYARAIAAEEGGGYAARHGDPAARMQHLAERVRGSCPPLVCLAAALGLPGLMQLVLRHAPVAFLPAMMMAPKQPCAGGRKSGAEPAMVVPAWRPRKRLKAEPPTQEGQALADLLLAANAAGPPDTSVLHSVVISESAETLCVIQTEAAALSMELNWLAAVDRSLHGGLPGQAMRKMTAMELAAHRLPHTMSLCEQALSCGALAAQAWLESARVLRFGCPGGGSAAGLAAEIFAEELTRLAHSVVSERWQSPWTLVFTDLLLESEWMRDVYAGCKRVLLLVALLLLLPLVSVHQLRVLQLPIAPGMLLAMWLLSLLLTFPAAQPRTFKALSWTHAFFQICVSWFLEFQSGAGASAEPSHTMTLVLVVVIASLLAPLRFRTQLLVSLVILAGQPLLPLPIAADSAARWHASCGMVTGHLSWLLLQRAMESHLRIVWLQERLARFPSAQRN